MATLRCALLVLALLAAALGAASASASTTTTTATTLTLRDDAAQSHALDARFLSLTIDLSLVLDHYCPYDAPKVEAMVRALGPVYVRVGGTRGDTVFYNMSAADAPVDAAPPPFERVLNRTAWDRVNRWAQRLGVALLFGVNAGVGPRVGASPAGAWRPDNLAELVAYTRAAGYDVRGWEFGNEPNLFFLAFGLDRVVLPARYGDDVRAFAAWVRANAAPGALVIAADVAYSPLIGEIWPFAEPMMARAGDVLDALSWHFYPTLGSDYNRTVPPELDPFYATTALMVDPNILDQAAFMHARIAAVRDKYAPHAALWLGETGAAVGGGQEGVSDRFAVTFELIDKLGAMAAAGEALVCRQTIAGYRYGYVSFDLAVRPHYFAMLAFKRLVGAATVPVALAADAPRTLRAYAYCAPHLPGAVVVSLLNLDGAAAAQVALAGVAAAVPRSEYVFTSDALDSTNIFLNGAATTLNVTDDGQVPDLEPRVVVDPALDTLVLPPYSWGFFVLPDAGFAATCGGGAGASGRRERPVTIVSR